MTRQRQALGGPPTGQGQLTGFPRWTLEPTRATYRAHSAGNGPWWFSTARGTTADGRFDLVAPLGTCYLAATEAAAIRERWGRNLVGRGNVMAADADGTAVSVLSVPSRHRLADTCAIRATNYGVTREIGTVTPYALPQAWAAAFQHIGCRGVRYEPRFSTGPRELAYALFGEAANPDWPTDPAPATGRAAALRAGIKVLDPPPRVPITRPPD